MATKGTGVVAFRLREEIIAALDRAAERRGLTRTQMVAALFAETYAIGDAGQTVTREGPMT